MSKAFVRMNTCWCFASTLLVSEEFEIKLRNRCHVFVYYLVLFMFFNFAFYITFPYDQCKCPHTHNYFTCFHVFYFLILYPCQRVGALFCPPSQILFYSCLTSIFLILSVIPEIYGKFAQCSYSFFVHSYIFLLPIRFL